MNLNEKSLNLAYKICAQVGVKNYSDVLPDVQRTLLSAFVGVYIKARHDELNKREYDPATQMSPADSSV